jgi:hypothetical protein
MENKCGPQLQVINHAYPSPPWSAEIQTVLGPFYKHFEELVGIMNEAEKLATRLTAHGDAAPASGNSFYLLQVEADDDSGGYELYEQHKSDFTLVSQTLVASNVRKDTSAAYLLETDEDVSTWSLFPRCPTPLLAFSSGLIVTDGFSASSSTLTSPTISKQLYTTLILKPRFRGR